MKSHPAHGEVDIHVNKGDLVSSAWISNKLLKGDNVCG